MPDLDDEDRGPFSKEELEPFRKKCEALITAMLPGSSSVDVDDWETSQEVTFLDPEGDEAYFYFASESAAANATWKTSTWDNDKAYELFESLLDFLIWIKEQPQA